MRQVGEEGCGGRGGDKEMMMTFITQGGEGQGNTSKKSKATNFLIDGGLYCDTALRKARVGNAVCSRHQSTNASKPPNQKHVRLAH